MPSTSFLGESVVYGFAGPYRFLSNFHPSPIRFASTFATREIDVDDTILYPSVEHAFQAVKTHDRADRSRIAALPKPGQAKRQGRRLTLRSDWEDVKDRVMLEALSAKFAPTAAHEGLASLLLETQPRELVWANAHHSRIWGVDVHSGSGENRLGIMLMRVRTELAEPQIECVRSSATIDLPCGQCGHRAHDGRLCGVAYARVIRTGGVVKGCPREEQHRTCLCNADVRALIARAAED